jgi:hypothetical protein
MQQGITEKNITRRNGGATGPIDTEADMYPGQSGGPLWLLPETDGVRCLYGGFPTGSESDTLFAGGTEFVNVVSQARKNFP